MIVCYQPGGTVKDSRVILKHDELLPNRFNIPESIVYRDDPDMTGRWLLIKGLNQVLPEDSPLLSQPGLPDVGDILSLTVEENGDTVYQHRDIIRLDEEEEKES